MFRFSIARKGLAMSAVANLLNGTISETPANDAVVIISRVIDAPREKVWTAFTTPEHVKQWYGGHGFQNPVCEMDVRPGGRWRHVMRTPDGTDFQLEFIFVDVVKPERLVWKNANPSRPGGPPTSVNTVTFVEENGRTRWRLVARFDSIGERDRAVANGFSKVVLQGSDKLQTIAEAL